jgi:hypothetical protein
MRQSLQSQTSTMQQGLVRAAIAAMALIISPARAAVKKHIPGTLDSIITAIANMQIQDTLIHSSLYGDADVCVINFGERRYAFIAVGHNRLYTCLWQGNSFVPTDSISTDRDVIMSYRITDINGDRYDDLILSGYGNMHGMQVDYIFTGQPAGQLVYRATPRALFNCTFNKQNGLLTSFYVGGVNSIHSKSHYRWQGIRLVPVEEWAFDMEASVLYHYVYTGQTRKLKDKQTDGGKAWHKIEKTLIWP